MNEQVVYLITDGEYSDYHISAVFSTRELAEAFICKRGSGDVEEWAVDENKDLTHATAWVKRVDIVGGLVEDWSEKPVLIKPGERVPSDGGWDRDKIYTTTEVVHEVYRHRYGESYVSKEHAEKLAVEARQEALRKLGGVANLSPGRNEYWLYLKSLPDGLEVEGI